MNKYKYIFFAALTVVILSCQNEVKLDNVPEEPVVHNLLTVVQLKGDSTTVCLTDYFPKPEVIDSVSVMPPFTYGISSDKTALTLVAKTDSIPALSILGVWARGSRYDLVIRKSRKLPITFTYNPEGKKVKMVQLAGQINDWNPSATNLSFNGKNYSTKLLLNPGKYQYQVVVDGKWILDPANPVKEENGIGGFNSVLQVGNNNPDSIPQLVVNAANGNTVNIKVIGHIDNVIALWQNYLLTSQFVKVEGNSITISIPQNAKRLERSYMRVWGYNKNGESNNLLIPLEGNKPVSSSSQLKRSDKNTQVMYFLMVDRFNNGDLKNDYKVNDPEVLPKANYYGGDLEGVTQKIKDGYFSKLGISTIWLSPIVQNPLDAWGLFPNPRTKFSGYHGYWPISSTKIDFRFGNDSIFTDLLTEAHKRNINVILDYVANHVHIQHPLYKEHPDWATSLYLPDGTLNTERWDDHRLTTWFDVFLPTLDLERSEVYEPMTDSALYWVTHFELDGFRHDATKHIHENFWRRLTQKIKLNLPGKSIFQIGETYGSRELIASYIGSGMLDSQFDFNVYDASVAAFARPDYSFAQLDASLHETFNYYGWINLMGYISGNQDRARFISYAGGALRFDEDAKVAGWTRDIGVGDSTAYGKLCMLNAFNMTIPGVPTIYYGDEFGMPGGNDPDNRRMMKFSGLNHAEQKTLNTVTKLVNLRRDNLALVYGNFVTLTANDSIYCYLRKYLDNVVVVVFNKSNEEKILNVKLPDYVKDSKLYSQFGSKFSYQDQDLSVTVQPNSFEILVTNK
ncbi:MAG TPA: alpha-amylase family glycosyl hydrolase [Tenuifilaceae bacterium]|nr:alpha-amylase family glycosyl hydrolase [Tenuifilaceae bacterium]